MRTPQPMLAGLLSTLSLICISSLNAATIDATTPETFAQSLVSVINKAEESGNYGNQDMIVLRLGGQTEAMAALAYATERGGPNVTPKEAQMLAAEYLRQFHGADANTFIQILKDRQLDRNKVRLKTITDKLNSLGSKVPVSAGLPEGAIKNYVVNGSKERVQILLSPPQGFALFEVEFKRGEAVGRVELSTATSLDSAEVIGDRIFLGTGNPRSFEVEKASVISKFNPKFFEWAEIAHSNKVDKFKKPFPGEDPVDGYHFEWDGTNPTIVRRNGGSWEILDAMMVFASPDIPGIYQKAIEIQKACQALSTENDRNKQTEIDNLFN